MSLPYWIEHDQNGKVGRYVWIKVPRLVPGTNVFTVQKRSGFSPNGEATFLFFDDFLTLDTSKWSVRGYPGYSLTASSGFLVGNLNASLNTSVGGYSLTSYYEVPEENFVVEMLGWYDSGTIDTAEMAVGVCDRTGSYHGTYNIPMTALVSALCTRPPAHAALKTPILNNVASTLLSQSPLKLWWRLTLIHANTKTAIAESDLGTFVLSGSYSISKRNITIYSWMWNYNPTFLSLKVDWVFVRKHDPSVSVTVQEISPDCFLLFVESGRELFEFQVGVKAQDLKITSPSEGLFVSKTFFKLSPAKLFSGKVVPVGGRCSLGLSCEPSCPLHVKERFFLSPASDEGKK
ncbi:MAG: DUF2341 domain-containing protein [Thermofilum sp.]